MPASCEFGSIFVCTIVEFCRVDDIEDDSELRRGKPGMGFPSQSHMDDCSLQRVSTIVAHRVFGIPQTINSANYVYFLAYEEVLRIGRLAHADNRSDSGISLIQILNGISVSQL
jgi:geranylgeranyl pyrophosphate synthase